MTTTGGTPVSRVPGAVTDAHVVAGWVAGHAGWSSAAADAIEIEGEGVVTAISGTCPTVVLTILGVPITVNEATVFRTGERCEQLSVSDRVEVHGVLITTNGSLTVIATSIHIEDEENVIEVEGEGVVDAVTGSCPSLTLTVNGLTVMTDAQTEFTPPGSCALIRVGTQVRARAVPTGASSFVARRVDLRGQREFMEGEGVITRTANSCPDLTIFVGDIEVRVTPSTVFEDGSCADLVPGARIEARGQRDNGGPIVAIRVRIRRGNSGPGNGELEGEGTISSVSGSCPSKTFVVNGFTAVTVPETRFDDGTCADVVAGRRIRARGEMRGTTIVALRIEFR